MKKEVLLFTFLLVLLLPFALADNESEQVAQAYDCLEDKVEGNCSILSLEQAIFSLLAIGECESEVEAAGSNDCWPAENCNVKTTAQAILALDKVGANTEDAEIWLLAQKETPTNLNWFLEIDSTEETTCTISYSGTSHQIIVREDKTLSSSAGTCLSLAQSNYWFRISPTCFDVEFEVTCDQSFLTGLLFKKTDSSTIYVEKDPSTASPGGSTRTQVNSFCFANGNECDYEGSLWATLVLDKVGEEIDSFVPYLTTIAEDYDRFLPESFLYLITGFADFRNNLLLKQKTDYWEESGDKYYDTALVLLALQDQTADEKANAKEWLLESQDDEGCWQGNIRNTAFILYSTWPKIISRGTTEPDCEEMGYDCVSEINCEGHILEYECAGLFVCCDTPISLETCSAMNGIECNYGEDCTGTMLIAADTNDCCVEGICQEIGSSSADCEEQSGYICEPSGFCDEEYTETFSYTCDFGYACCMPDSSSSGGSSIFIWVLVILVVLVIVGIVFKDKLRSLWFRLKSKGRGSGPSPSPGTRFPPSSPRMPPKQPIQRRILPPTQPRPARRPAKKKPSEMDDVLKKLKEMGS